MGGERIDLTIRQGTGQWLRSMFSGNKQPVSQDIDPTEWMPIGRVEGRLGLDTATVQSLVANGKIVSRRMPDDSILVSVADIERLAKAQEIVMTQAVENNKAVVTASDDHKSDPAIRVQPAPKGSGDPVIIESAVMRG